ncbi:Protein of unknown function [Tessaracoccus bendigoensis DSM 12906]|uniref:Carbon monoxide dehydrogenase subunit G n=1 Tax=Tessaracoccus bendigoensis DSM 12906 TaxID=1123357 RepID=A0A1M6AI22_9ACTN|nr:DUF2505 domain-containing protein [Tessaracoccus bendigoensis]SHI36150.1 Protein of unknown function [Tessaracoccus bendigoensis DSM 12906]
MKLDYTHSYDAAPETVAALLRNTAFLDDVATHAGATEHTVEVTADHTKLGMVLAVPGNLTKFIGSSIRINQVFRFEALRADGSIPGTVEVDVPGMPVEVNATAALTPRGARTEGRYTGDLTVRVPLFGKKIESQVEPFITDAFDGLERRATDWLSRKP